MSSRVSLGRRVAMLVGLLMAGILLLSVTGSVAITRQHHLLERMREQGHAPTAEALKLHRALYRLRGDVYKLLLLPGEQEKVNGDLETSFQRVDSSLSVLHDLGKRDADLAGRIEGLSERVAAYRSAVGDIRSRAQAGDRNFGMESLRNGAAHHAREALDGQAKDLLTSLEERVARIDAEAQASSRRAEAVFWTLTGLLVGFGAWRSWVFSRDLLGTVGHVVTAVERLGEGDFRDHSGTALVTSREEEGLLASLGAARERLRSAFAQIRSGARSSLEAAEHQRELAGTLRVQSQENERRAVGASGASREASQTLETVAREAGGASEQLGSVAAAVEEMTASIGEIARSADRTRQMTGHALEGSRSALRRMEELETASREVEAVVEMIVDISEQTKLLALNATIEAARAGDAGKGFAVVAGEVKELAKGTAEASEDIRRRIEAIRQSSGNAGSEIRSVAESMEELGGGIHAIAGAVEQQSATTSEISRHVNDAAGATKAIHRDLQDCIQAVGGITEGMSGILEAEELLRTEADRAAELSDRARETASTLENEVERFRVG